MKKHKEIILVLVALFSVLTLNIGQSFANNDESQSAFVDITETKFKPAFFTGDILFNNSLEIPGKRTINSKTYKNLDGTSTLVIDTEPVHYKDISGNWHNINTDLVDSSDAAFDKEAVRSLAKIKFYKPSANSDVVSIQALNKQVSFRPVGYGKNGNITKVAPNLSNRQFNNNKAKYINVYEDADLEYTVGPKGIKEDIVLNKYTGANVFAFNVKASGMNLSKESDGSLIFSDKESSEKIFVMPRPYSFDSGDSFDLGATTYDFETLGPNNYLIKVIVDDVWLSSSERVYPVTIDPTTETYQATSTSTGKDATLNQYSPTTNYGTGNLTVGEAAGGTDYKALVRIGGFSGIPSGATIDQAVWSVNMYAQSSSTNVNLTWNIIDNTWGENTVTWNTQPSTLYGPSYGIAVGTSGGTFGWKNWDITDVFNSWRLGQRTNNGLMLWVNASNYNIYKQFYGNNSGYSNSTRPKLAVTYNEKPFVSNSSHTGDQWIGITTPQLNWTYSDPDGDLQTKLQVQVSTNTGFTSLVYDSGPINGVNHYRSVPSNTLSTNTRYYWRVKVYDGYAWSNWSSYTSFRVDVTPPANPSLIIANDAQFTGTDIVSLNNISATDTGGSGVSQMQFSNDNVVWSGWYPYASSYSGWSIAPPLGDGTKNVYARLKDIMGNISSSSTSSPLDTIILDTAGPTALLMTPNETDHYSGPIEITGSADDANLDNWKLEWGAGASPTEWNTIGNLVDNWTMDIDANSNGVADGWTKQGTGQFIMDNDDFIIGQNNIAQKITAYTPGDNYLVRTISGLRQNTTYAFSARVKTYNVKPVTGVGTRLKVDNSVIGSHYSSTLAGNVDWTNVSVNFNTGNSASVDLYLEQGSAGTATGHSWFDETQLSDASSDIFFNFSNSMKDSILSDYLGTFDASNQTSGQYLIKLSVTDKLERTTVDQQLLNIDAEVPDVAVTSPANGNIVNGIISVQASALDNISGIEKVRFVGSSADLGEDYTAPYEISWNTDNDVNGPQTIHAIAFDTAGNESSSDTIEVNVDNAFTTSPSQPIKEWALLGTFDNSDQQTRLSTDYLDGENLLTYDGGEIISGRTCTTLSASANYVDLSSIYGQSANQIAYANVYIKSMAPQPVKFHFGSDDAIKVWVNGEITHSVDESRVFEEDSDQVSAQLNNGWNHVLVKLAKGNSLPWRFSAKISDAQDYSLGNIEVSSVNPFSKPILNDNFNRSMLQAPNLWTSSANVSISNHDKNFTLASSVTAGSNLLTISNSQDAEQASKIIINPNQSNEETITDFRRNGTSGYIVSAPIKNSHQEGEPIISLISEYLLVNGETSKASLVSSSSLSTSSYSYDVNITYLDENRDAYILFRTIDENNTYRLSLGESNKISIEKVTNGVVARLGADSNFTFNTGQNYNILLKIRGNEIRVFIDGISYLLESDNNSPYLNPGKIGLISNTGTILRIDNVIVSPIIAIDFDNIVKGIVTDSTNGQPVTELPVTLITEVDDKDDNIDLMSYTENDGSYFIDLDENLDAPLTNYVPKEPFSTTSKVSTQIENSTPEPINLAIEADHPGFSLEETSVTVSTQQPTVTKNFTIGRSGRISGLITDKNHNPVSDAFVKAIPFNGSFSAKSAVTGSDGIYVIDDVNAPYIYDVRVTASDYSVNSISDIQVTPELETTNANIVLELDGSISGTITDEQGLPVEGASVFAYPSGLEDLKIGTVSSPTGSYSISGLDAPGTYILSATKEAFKLYSKYDISVQPNEDTPNINIVLGLSPSYSANRNDPGGSYNSKQTHGTHEKMIARAISILALDKGKTSGAYKWFFSGDNQNMNTSTNPAAPRAFWYWLVKGNWYADWGPKIGLRGNVNEYIWPNQWEKPLIFADYRGGHGHDPGSHEGWYSFRSAGVMADHYSAVANFDYWDNIAYMSTENNFAKHQWMFWAGVASHFVQDARVPQHTDGGQWAGLNNVMHDMNRHNAYERYVDHALVEKDEYKIESTGQKGIYTFNGYKDKQGVSHKDPKTAFGWVDQGAHVSKNHFWKTNTTADSDKYYYIATHETQMVENNGKTIDNFSWVGKGDDNPTFPKGGYYKKWYWTLNPWGLKTRKKEKDKSVGNDYWYRNQKLVKSTVKTTAGFLFGSYIWIRDGGDTKAIRGDWQTYYWPEWGTDKW